MFDGRPRRPSSRRPSGLVRRLTGTPRTPTPLRSAVFLDRDGVLNAVRVRGGTPEPPRSAKQMILMPGVTEACRRLRDLGYLLVVVTNQPGIARGTQSPSEVGRMHAFLRQRLPIEDILMCPHDDADGCRCRKPEPGMLLDAAARLGLDVTRSFCVGDRWRDVEAARRAGVRAIYLDRDYGERKAVGADATVSSLDGAVRFIESSRLHGAMNDPLRFEARQDLR